MIFFLMGETSDIYLLNFICVSVKQVIALKNSFLWTQRSLLIAPMCIFPPTLLFEWVGAGKNVLTTKQ